MQLLAVTNLPIDLALDKAPLPFGDPIEGVMATAAAPGVFTVPGYDAPAVNDLISFTFLAGGSMPAPLVAAVPVYVQSIVSAAAGTFTVSLTLGGAAVTTTTTGASLVAHLLSNEVDGVTLPFKPNNTVTVENTLTGSTLVLQSTNDLNLGKGPSQGPNTGAWATLVSLVAGAQALVTLNNDWIRVSSAGTLYLKQN
jgi:hypothetical protein